MMNTTLEIKKYLFCMFSEVKRSVFFLISFPCYFIDLHNYANKCWIFIVFNVVVRSHAFSNTCKTSAESELSLIFMYKSTSMWCFGLAACCGWTVPHWSPMHHGIVMACERSTSLSLRFLGDERTHLSGAYEETFEMGQPSRTAVMQSVFELSL